MLQILPPFIVCALILFYSRSLPFSYWFVTHFIRLSESQLYVRNDNTGDSGDRTSCIALLFIFLSIICFQLAYFAVVLMHYIYNFPLKVTRTLAMMSQHQRIASYRIRDKVFTYKVLQLECQYAIIRKYYCLKWSVTAVRDNTFQCLFLKKGA